MSHTDPRYNALYERFPDILSDTESDPALAHLIDDLDAYMNVAVSVPEPALTPRQHSGRANLSQAIVPEDPSLSHSSKPLPRRMSTWLATVAAVLVVALLAGALLTRVHGTVSQTNTGYHQFSPAKGACAPGDIKTHLPANSEFGSLAMVSPNEGWAVGGIVDPTNFTSGHSLILHYAHCAWMPVSIGIPHAGLSSISMGSAVDGWAVGSVDSLTPLALHYANGVWTRETLPGESTLDGHGGYSTVRMLSADEGWIVISYEKNSQGYGSSGLLHRSNGHWSMVNNPFPIVEAVLPVAPNEAWIVGSASNSQESPVLYHYQAGMWSKVVLHAGVMIDHLRMVSPNDIWASGQAIRQSDSFFDQTAAVLHYDGTAWTQVSLGSAAQAQIVDAFGADESWAFTFKDTQKQPCQPGADRVIDKVQFGGGAIWQTTPWQFKDLSWISTLERVAPDEYWAIGYYAEEKVTPTGNGGCSAFGYGVPVLLYFASGTWHQYRG